VGAALRDGGIRVVEAVGDGGHEQEEVTRVDDDGDDADVDIL
jgi:hypothetical protein